MIRRPPRSTLDRSSAASDVYKRQGGAIGSKKGNTAAGAIIGAAVGGAAGALIGRYMDCLLYTSPSPRDRTRSRMPSSA